jgi:D-3-phosphoglycerate dehydrogenase / 2-oxoglutarate reductase
MEIGIYDVDDKVKEKAQKLGYIVFSSVDELTENSQIISLHVPSLVETENTINQEKINLMKKDTVIINTARGKLIDEEALIKALKEERIAGAALDVYRDEPLKNEKLYSIKDNLVLTPHIGSQTKETQIEASVSIAEKICEFLKKPN